jgi:predicted small lipoprotein YifL
MRLMFLVVALCALAGCGKKGDLYLPDPTPSKQSQPTKK